jgi:hypothetical protein
MSTHRVALGTLSLVVLSACRSGKAPAPEPSAAAPERGSTPAAVAEGEAEGGALPTLGLVDGYAVSDEELRRATSLTQAVLILPASADDPMATAFRETGVRFARLQRDERFGQYAGGGIGEDSVRPWLDLAARELALHSPALIRHSGTRWVAFCRDLRQGGQPRYAVPAGPAGILLLDAGAFSSEDFFRRAFHHELFHMIDFAEGRARADAEWTALNPPATRYGKGGRWSQDASDALGSGGPGFVTEYAGAAVEEDKAELFALLALASDELRDLGQRDPVIASKRDLLLRRLAPYCADYGSRLVCREYIGG